MPLLHYEHCIQNRCVTYTAEQRTLQYKERCSKRNIPIQRTDVKRNKMNYLTMKTILNYKQMFPYQSL